MLGILIVAVILSLACLCIRGLPKPVESVLLDRINSGPFAWQLKRLHFCPGAALVAENARVFRKGVVGHPLFEAPTVDLDVDLASLMSGGSFVEGFSIHEGVFRRDTSGRSAVGRTNVFSDFTFELEDCNLEGVWFEHCSGRYMIRGTEVVIHDARGVAGQGVQRGRIAGEFSFDRVTRTYDYHFKELEIDPHAAVPMLRDRGLNPVADLIERFNFPGGNPRLELRLRGRAGDDPEMRLEGRLQSDAALYRGAEFSSLDVTFSGDLSNRAKTIVLSPLKLTHGVQSLTADCTLDLVASTTTFKMTSTVHPRRVARMVSDKLEVALQQAHFGPRTAVDAEGVIGHKDPALTDVQASISGEGLGFGPFVAEQCSLVWTMRGRSNHFSNVQGDLWGGTVVAEAAVFPDPQSGTGRCFLEFDADRISFKDYAHHVLKKEGDSYVGLLSFDGFLAGEVKKDWIKESTGRFDVKIEKGSLFRIPLFGGLTAIITRFIKPLDKMLEQTEATADVVVGGQRMRTDNLKIEGKLLSVAASGRYGFDQSLDFEVKVTPRDKSLLQKLLKLPFDVLNELFFEIGLTGSLDDPKWYLRRFSKDIFD